MSVQDFTRIIDPDKCVGKTIEAVKKECHRIGFRFSDQTYFFCEAVEGGYGDGPEIDTRAHLDDYLARGLGLMTEEEYQQIQANGERRAFERVKAEYELLRAKYEPTQPDAGSA